MNINSGKIMSKVKAYSKTAEGKGKIRSVIEKYTANNTSTTAAGSKIVTRNDMIMLAESFITALKQQVTSLGLPESVIAHFDSLKASEPILRGGKRGYYEIDISFTDDLSRLSLRLTNGERTGDGIRNIVSVFDTGVHANKTAKGIWDSHEELGVIRSKKDRDGLHFMKNAIDNFSMTYGSMYGAKAVISADPEFYTR